GQLDNGGETLKLVKPGITPDQDATIDEVSYDDDAPWPAAADGFGPSLQLVDPAQDNNRVANWAAVTTGGSNVRYTPGAPNSVRTNLAAFPLVWLNEIQPNNVAGLQDNAGDRDPWVELFNSSRSSVDLTGYYLSDNYTHLAKWAFPGGTTLTAGQYRLVWLD